MKKQSRNLGIDLLRVISMLGVVVLHVMGHGGVLKLCQTPLKFSLAWLLEILAFPAVNCFVLISGYIGYRGGKVFPKLKNILSLFFTVLFYSVVIGGVFMALGLREFSVEEVLKCLQPTTKGTYWFFSSYVGLFLLSPFINMLVHRSNLKQAVIFLLVFFTFSLVSVRQDTFDLLDGYSVIWMALVYAVGGILKKYDLTKLFSRWVWLLLVVAAWLVTWATKVGFYYSTVPFWQEQHGNLVNYTSPTIVLMAIGLLAVFSSVRFSVGQKVLSFFSVSAFSVYLIHDNPFVRKTVVAQIRHMVGDLHSLWLALSVVGFVVGIFIVCILLDKVRIGLFRLIRVDSLCVSIESLVKRWVHRLYQKIDSKL